MKFGEIIGALVISGCCYLTGPTAGQGVVSLLCGFGVMALSIVFDPDRKE